MTPATGTVLSMQQLQLVKWTCGEACPDDINGDGLACADDILSIIAAEVDRAPERAGRCAVPTHEDAGAWMPLRY